VPFTRDVVYTSLGLAQWKAEAGQGVQPGYEGRRRSRQWQESGNAAVPAAVRASSLMLTQYATGLFLIPEEAR